MANIPWPEDKKQQLEQLWPKVGLSASMIGDELGYSRNAVIGMARRMDLGPKTPGKHRMRRPKPPKLPVVVAPAAIKPPPPSKDGNTCSLLDAQPWQCRSIIEGKTDRYGLAMVCGNPVPPEKPFQFCALHRSLYVITRQR